MVLRKLPMTDSLDYEEITEEDLNASPSRNLASICTELQGVDVPSNTSKPFSNIDRQRWLNVIETLMGRGIEHSGRIAGITGLSPAQVTYFKKEILAVWQKTTSPSTVNLRREKLYIEAERVKEACWRAFNRNEHDGLGDFKEQTLYLKMILEAGTRQAQLCGLNRVDAVEHNANITVKKDEKTMIQEAENKLSLPVGSLDLIGKALAKQISDMKEENNG
tara:strand:- start:5854 stop:6513 length:660 start_codon:yes stop_codon:yes gene_type:complete